jgi:hypothetical protein
VFECETHFFTNGGECKGWSPMNPKCTPILRITLMGESQMFKTLVGKVNKHQIGPPRYHWKKVLKFRCLKCPCIVHLDLICMSYDKKKGLQAKLRI